ncbi:hypothetical protein E4T56_gene513 [Termitomyces sp. T112]|nr:hypothetical protein E4T56_gene513 [Termitomyces sp. T112]
MKLEMTCGVVAGWTSVGNAELSAWSNSMDSSAGVSSEDTPELDAGLVVVTATDDKGPSSFGAAFVEGATDKGSFAAASEALTASAVSCIKRRVASALMDLEEHAEVLPVSHGDGPGKGGRCGGVARAQEQEGGTVFLGFINFYQRFIQDFSHYAHPLFDLTGKDIAWSWGPPEQAAFNDLKCTVTSGPILLFSDDNSPFRGVEANSSDFAIGAILLQQSPEDGKWHLVAFYSKSLNAVEQN